MRSAAVIFCLLVAGIVPASAQSPNPAQSPATAETTALTAALAQSPAPAESTAPAQSPAPADPAVPAQPPTPTESAALAQSLALAQSCPGNPDAIGTSRTITVEPSAFPRIGNIQYRNTLPLNDHEVVLTFDDGPIPPYSNSILDTLDSQCVKATYFMVGDMARNYPSIVRRIYNAGHTIGTHSQTHPRGFQHLSSQSVERQVDGGIASVDAALGDPKAVSPFFRIPGLGRSNTVESFLAEHKLVTWSADIDTNDWWRGSTPSQIVQRAMRRLNEKGRGILLMHDIHPATVMALPMLLKELKAGGYRVVQVVAAGERPKSVPELVASPAENKGNWPRVVTVSAHSADKVVKVAKTAKALHHRKRVAHNDSDPKVSAGIAKKKSKTKTAETGTGPNWFRR